MQGKKYFWQNDYLDGDTINYIEERDQSVQALSDILKDFKFNDALIDPIVKTIKTVIAENGKFIVVGDYDVDGTSATTILVKALTLLGAIVSYYIPNRFTDGYGINAQMVELFHADEVGCLITVDNGIVAFEAATRARELGVLLIITDHHAPGKVLPDATHILHPALDPNMQDRDICGASVAFLLAKDLLATHHELPNIQGEFLQLVALATIADMMPLDQPWNRALSYHGFKQMHEQPLLLLSAFLQLREQNELVSDDLSFNFIPSINSVGRIADSNAVVAAFLSTELDEAREAMQSFLSYNDERKRIMETLYADILTSLPETAQTDTGFLLVVGKDWHQGVLGIIAQRLMQSLSRPVIVLTNSREDEARYTGSARAFGTYSVAACFDQIQAALVKSGGHQYAGGLSVVADQMDELTTLVDGYNDELARTMRREEQVMPLLIDAWLPFHDLDYTFLQQQDVFAPYGEKNKKFVIGVKQVQIVNIQELGKTQQHVKLRVVDGAQTYQIVAFHMFDLCSEIASYAFVDIVVEVQRNYFNGAVHIQYLLLDIRVPRKQIFDFRQRKYERDRLIGRADTIIVDNIPLDKADFLGLVGNEQIEKIYLPSMPFEDALLYANTIDQQYFTFVYKYVKQKQTVDLQDDALYRELMRRKLPKSIFLYILKVFFDLNFVIIENNVCHIKADARKRKLADSQAYNEMEDWLALRSTLLTGTIDALYETLTMQ